MNHERKKSLLSSSTFQTKGLHSVNKTLKKYFSFSLFCHQHFHLRHETTPEKKEKSTFAAFCVSELERAEKSRKVKKLAEAIIKYLPQHVCYSISCTGKLPKTAVVTATRECETKGLMSSTMAQHEPCLSWHTYFPSSAKQQNVQNCRILENQLTRQIFYVSFQNLTL